MQMTHAERMRTIAASLHEVADDLDIEARVEGRQMSSFDWSVRCATRGESCKNRIHVAQNAAALDSR